MNVIDFITYFSGITSVPIDLEDHVIPKLVEAKLTDEIYPFYDSKLPPGKLTGHFVQEIIPTDAEGGTKRMATITYGANTDEMQRLAACKEAMSLFDPEHCQVNNQEEYDALVSKIVLPPELVDAVNEDGKVLTDRIAVLQAIAVLFPMAARNLLLPKYQEKKITLEEIAELVELPPFAARYVMSDTWPKTHENLLKLLQHIHQIKD
ncbi:hypothetical protein [Aestuariivirga litoralis]|uniref:hypothetical protein n=1 Tax=Aestuariivirga litoralis TaxID=2650924 RepID=UPI0018C51863|nr:hypothetical protein [Aestuariivirga litoralis]MBG1233994.1 hypothetical protein [Aestuariivirga litoralis]